MDRGSNNLSPFVRRAIHARFGIFAGVILAAHTRQPFTELGDGMNIALRDERFARWIAAYTMACVIEHDLVLLRDRWECIR